MVGTAPCVKKLKDGRIGRDGPIQPWRCVEPKQALGSQLERAEQARLINQPVAASAVFANSGEASRDREVLPPTWVTPSTGSRPTESAVRPRPPRYSDACVARIGLAGSPLRLLSLLTLPRLSLYHGRPP